MRINHGLRGAAVSLAGVLITPAALAGPNGHACSISCGGHDAQIEATPALQAALEASLFNMLPEEHKTRLAAGELARLNAIGDEIARAQDEVAARQGPFDYAKVAHVMSREAWDNLRPFHQKLLVTLAEAPALPDGQMRPALCFTPDADPEMVYAVSALLGHADNTRFQQTNRWSTTASGGTGTQGTPITLRYSYVPDGTFVPDLIGGASGSSQLFAWLNGIYGTPAVWQPIFDQVFDRWSEVMGVTYIFEPNDDGSQLNTGAGVIGVRGDLRIAAIPIDGNSGILAYNNFPNDGDMVFDAFDSFYNTTSSQSLRFRNVIAHEHGHGAGMLHVCPVQQTKLMEPFLTVAFDGPQPDDILNGQRHYGDPLEPNDSSGAATVLGTFGTGGGTFVNDVSIDDDADTDFYRFTVNAAQGVTITVTPAAPPAYQQGPQTQACNTGTVTNYNTIHDLSIQLIASNGTTVLASSNSAGLGQPEILVGDVPAAGNYFIRVLGGSANSIQLYDLDLDVTAPPFQGILITLPGGTPSEVDPGVTTPFTVEIDPQNESIVGTPQLSVAADGVNFTNLPLTFVSGTTWTATLPAFECADSPRFFIQATGTVTGNNLNPTDAPFSAFSAIVGDFQNIITDNFETNLGWTVTNSGLTDGAWTRGVPVGGGDRGDPPSDYDGSGQCYLTDNVDGNSDVDGGQTILTSPAFDGSGSNAIVSYARWFDNTGSGTGANPGTDTFLVQISNNGGSTWQALETVGPNTSESSGGWFFKSFNIASVITPSSNMRVRFIAQDPDPGAVVEAGVDAFSVTSVACTDPPPPNCLADWDNSGGQPNSSDFLAYLNDFSAQNPDADLAPPGGDGTFDSSDFLAYLNAYSQGC